MHISYSIWVNPISHIELCMDRQNGEASYRVAAEWSDDSSKELQKLIIPFY